MIRLATPHDKPHPRATCIFGCLELDGREVTAAELESTAKDWQRQRDAYAWRSEIVRLIDGAINDAAAALSAWWNEQDHQNAHRERMTVLSNPNWRTA